jgi:hypothetical protein
MQMIDVEAGALLYRQLARSLINLKAPEHDIAANDPA